MRCEECQEQVLELIEREAVDPDGVREILQRCPDCRQTFDVLKATMALTAQMPIEEPAAALDAAVLRAAAARRSPGKVGPKRGRQAPPWAMAAVALLAVGIGVWVTPRGVQLEKDAAEPAASTAHDATVADELRAEPATPEEVSAPPARPEAMARKRRLRTPTPERKAEPARKAMASEPAADVAARGLAASGSSEAQAETEAVHEALEDRGEDGAAACRRRVEDLERRARAGLREPSKPEELLAIGECYQTLGNDAEARKWLTRAAKHRKTAKQARKALLELDSE